MQTFIHFQSELQLKTEETMYLRDSLDRNREKYEQEKRLNSAIKHKKVIFRITY